MSERLTVVGVSLALAATVALLVGCTRRATPPAEAELTFDTIAAAVPVDAQHTILVRARAGDGSPDKWTATSSDSSIFTVRPAESEVSIRGIRSGHGKLRIVSSAGLQREITVAVYDRTVLDTGELLLKYVTEFEDISGGDVGAIYHPVVDAVDAAKGWRTLGSLARPNPPRKPGWTIAVRADPDAHAERAPLADPVRFELEWKSDLPRHFRFSLWTPICRDGYVAMGMIATRNQSFPATESTTCVRKDLTAPAEVSVEPERQLLHAPPPGFDTPFTAYQITMPSGSNQQVEGTQRALVEAGTFVAFKDTRTLYRLPARERVERDIESWRQRATKWTPFPQSKTELAILQFKECWKRVMRSDKLTGTLSPESQREIWLCSSGLTDKPPGHSALNVLAINLPMVVEAENPTLPRLKNADLRSLGPASETEPTDVKVLLVPVTVFGGTAFQGPSLSQYIQRSPFLRLEKSSRFRRIGYFFCGGTLDCDKPGLQYEVTHTWSNAFTEQVMETTGISVSKELGLTLGGKYKGAELGLSAKRTTTVSFSSSWMKGFTRETMDCEKTSQNKPCPAEHGCAAWSHAILMELKEHADDGTLRTVPGSRVDFDSGSVVVDEIAASKVPTVAKRDR